MDKLHAVDSTRGATASLLARCGHLVRISDFDNPTNQMGICIDIDLPCEQRAFDHNVVVIAVINFGCSSLSGIACRIFKEPPREGHAKFAGPAHIQQDAWEHIHGAQ